MQHFSQLQILARKARRYCVSYRHSRGTFLIAALLFSAGLSAADTPLQLQISNETAPPAGWAQIKVFATKPSLIGAGSVSISLDPTVFGSPTDASVFSANGDAVGIGKFNSSTIVVDFAASPGPPRSSSIGQLAGLPILVITVPILSTAVPGTTVAIAGKTSNPGLPLPWVDANGNPVTILSGSLTVGGRLSIEKVVPGGGYLPAGTEISIHGIGFSASTALSAEAVTISEARVISPQEIRFTLRAPAELTAKKIVLQDTDGAETAFFSSLQPTEIQGQANPNGLFPLPSFPLQTWSGTVVDGSATRQSLLAIRNPNLFPVDVPTELNNSLTRFHQVSSYHLAAGGIAFVQVPGLTSFALTPSGPIQALDVDPLSAPRELRPSNYVPPQFAVNPTSLSFAWQIGTPLPEPKAFTIIPQFVFTTVGVPQDAPWLSATSSSASVNPAGLSPGIYRTTLTLTPNSLLTPPVQVPVTVSVTDQPVPAISAIPAILDFAGTPKGSPPPAQTVAIAGLADFTVRVDLGIFPAYGNWLKVTPSSGTGPATLTVSVDPTNVPAYAKAAGTIFAYGPKNTISIPVTLSMSGFTPSPTSLFFSVKTGSQPQSALIDVSTQAPTYTATPTTPWLRATISNSGVTVTADPSGLSAGSYTGKITISAMGMPSADVPVTLVLWDTPPPIKVTPSALTFVYPVGGPPPPTQTVMVDSGGTPVPITFGSPPNSSLITPYQFSYAIDPSGGPYPLGVFTSSFNVIGPANTITVPVTIVKTASTTFPPMIGSITNAASQIVGALAPGEIIAIRGFAVGPPNTTFFTMDPSGRIATSYSGTQVLFDGQPAPIIYASPNQVNAIVPYEVASKSFTNIEIAYDGIKSAAWGVPVATSVPAIFTLDGTGVGRAAALNQDNTVNDPSNPAPRGTFVQIYATGEGQTLPAGVTGSITRSSGIAPALKVTATVGGLSAPVQWYGETPESVTGLLAANVVLPFELAPGPAVPVTLTIGDRTSAVGTTIAVK
jgi:uncharacterized protein (TIGR03437 family)